MTDDQYSISDTQYPLLTTPPWTVSGLTRHIQERLELDPVLQDLWLAGEISNFSRAASGHLYFTLKDAGATISCVMWRSAAARKASCSLTGTIARG